MFLEEIVYTRVAKENSGNWETLYSKEDLEELEKKLMKFSYFLFMDSVI